MSSLPRSNQVVLFLQGPPSGFWPELAATFEAQGAKTLRVNFSLGDWLYWRRPGAINYRGRLADWPSFVQSLIEKHGVTDIVYYTDRLPYHIEAARIADTLGVKCHSIEFGYLRPDWLTLERGGMGSYSHFPTDPNTIRTIARSVAKPDMGVKYAHTFGQEAFNEVAYNLAAYFGKPFFHRYQADKYYDPLFEYVMWLPRLALAGQAARTAARLEKATLGQKFWLLGMQLQSDYQIRANSHYGHLSEMLDEVIGSFSRHTEGDEHLLIKMHPLDNGFERWSKIAAELAAVHGVANRVSVIDGGDLNALIARSKGVIIVNSTVGLHSLQAGRPTKVLGIAIYDIDGLTHQGSLDSFWTSPAPVDLALVKDLVLALAATIQVKGNFYHPEGRKVGTREIATRILEGRVNEPGAFIVPPPRLAEGLRRRQRPPLDHSHTPYNATTRPKEQPVLQKPPEASGVILGDKSLAPEHVTADDRLEREAIVLPFRAPRTDATLGQRQKGKPLANPQTEDGDARGGTGRQRSKGDVLPRPS